MEKNTVLLDILDYNDLKGFKDKVLDGKFAQLSYYDSEVFYYTESEIITGLEQDVESCFKRIKELKEKLNPKTKEPDISNLKEMNILQLLKWWNKK